MLALLIPKTPKGVFWLTAKTQMKCRIRSALFAKVKINFQRKKHNIFQKKIGEIITCVASIYTIYQPDLTVSNFMGNSTGTQRVNI